MGVPCECFLMLRRAIIWDTTTTMVLYSRTQLAVEEKRSLAFFLLRFQSERKSRKTLRKIRRSTLKGDFNRKGKNPILASCNWKEGNRSIKQRGEIFAKSERIGKKHGPRYLSYSIEMTLSNSFQIVIMEIIILEALVIYCFVFR